LHPDDRFKITAALTAAVHHGGPFSFEERVPDPAGVLRTIRTDGVVLSGGGHEPMRVVGLCVELTEPHALADALADREAALADAEQVLAEQRALLAAQVQELAAQARALQTRMVPQVVDYAALVREVLASRQAEAQAAGIRVLADVSSVPDSALDAVRVAQVLGKLLSNALQFTPTGGRVLLRVFEIGGSLVTEISDPGSSVPADCGERTFRRFEQPDTRATRQAGGTGLGLAIARGLVEAHGGAIGIADQACGSATLWFTLPVRA
jgi:two-component system sensor histidine kinase BaeS